MAMHWVKNANEKNSTGLHALDIVALCTNMLLLYKNAASMPDFILTMEEAQKKAKRAELPILDIELRAVRPIRLFSKQQTGRDTIVQHGKNLPIGRAHKSNLGNSRAVGHSPGGLYSRCQAQLFDANKASNY